MIKEEAYRLGYELGEKTISRAQPIQPTLQLLLPREIKPRTPQAILYRMGYRDALRARQTVIKKK